MGQILIFKQFYFNFNYRVFDNHSKKYHITKSLHKACSIFRGNYCKTHSSFSRQYNCLFSCSLPIWYLEYLSDSFGVGCWICSRKNSTHVCSSNVAPTDVFHDQLGKFHQNPSAHQERSQPCIPWV